MPFDRKAAMDYARKHWTIPCDDGIFWLDNERISIDQKRKELKAPAADGWQPKFVRYTDSTGHMSEKAVFEKSGSAEILIHDWAGIADCAHYLSKCLQAGGAKVDERGVHLLVMALQERADTKTLCVKVGKAAAQRVINTGLFKNGDMLGYFNISPHGDFGQIRYTHSTMFGGKLDAKDDGRVTCHSACRFPGLSEIEDRWWLKDDYLYTLIHFSDDDPKASPENAKAVAGWWKGTFGSDSRFYFMLADGRARLAALAPKKGNTTLSSSAAKESAYWFETAGVFTIVWQKTGSVETWTRDATSGGFKITLDGSRIGAAARMLP